MPHKQQPGRIEAMRTFLTSQQAPSVLHHIAGLDTLPQRRPPDPPSGAVTFTSGLEQLTQAERDALPF